MINPSQVSIIVAFQVRRLTLGPQGVLLAVVLLGIFGTLTISMANLAQSIAEFRANAGGVDVVGQLVAQFGSGLGWFLELTEDDIAVLFEQRSPVQLTFFAAALFFAPYVAILAGFDQTADDIRSRHLRYLLIRVDRLTLFISRAIGVMLVLAIGYGIALGGAIAVLLAEPEGFNSIEAYVYMGRIWASLLLVSLPFVLFLAFANVLTTNPYLSLGLLLGLQFALWVIVGFTEDDFEAIHHLYYLSPGWLK